MPSTPDLGAFQHQTAKANGVRLHYVTAGRDNGPIVVLLHGWPETWYEWRDIMPRLVEAGYRVLAPDLRGFGLSDKPQGGYDAANVAKDVHALVSARSEAPIYLVGHDIGMMVAYAYAAQFPNDVAKLAVMEALLPGLGLEKLMDTAEPGSSWHFAFHMEPNLPEALIAGRERTYLAYFFRQYAYDPTAIDDMELAYYARRYAAPGATRGGFMHYRAFPETARQNKRFSQNELPMPVLALGGAQSLRGAVRKQMEKVASNVHGGVVERAGHWIPEERPAELARRLLHFFSQ